jgi:hypothetical protein
MALLYNTKTNKLIGSMRHEIDREILKELINKEILTEKLQVEAMDYMAKQKIIEKGNSIATVFRHDNAFLGTEGYEKQIKKITELYMRLLNRLGYNIPMTEYPCFEYRGIDGDRRFGDAASIIAFNDFISLVNYIDKITKQKDTLLVIQSIHLVIVPDRDATQLYLRRFEKKLTPEERLIDYYLGDHKFDIERPLESELFTKVELIIKKLKEKVKSFSLLG